MQQGMGEVASELVGEAAVDLVLSPLSGCENAERQCDAMMC